MTDKGFRLRPPDYVVLGMVRLGARSGYDIKKAVRDSIRFFWTISEAQIYPSLERLERANLVRGRSAPQGKRQRRSFDITPQGEAALRGWLSGGEAMPLSAVTGDIRYGHAGDGSVAANGEVGEISAAGGRLQRPAGDPCTQARQFRAVDRGAVAAPDLQARQPIHFTRVDFTRGFGNLQIGRHN